jgi:hypothetical protein
MLQLSLTIHYFAPFSVDNLVGIESANDKGDISNDILLTAITIL